MSVKGMLGKRTKDKWKKISECFVKNCDFMSIELCTWKYDKRGNIVHIRNSHDVERIEFEKVVCIMKYL